MDVEQPSVNHLVDKVKHNLKLIADQCESPGFNEELSLLLATTGSVIAGGFVLGSINDSLAKSSDIDIYTPYATFRPILDFLLKRGEYTDVNVSSPYDSSFFNKNGILVRFGFCIDGDYEHSCSIDLMILKEDRKVLDTVSNFDFTFCEVWYDGINVGGTHLQDTLNHKGSLRKEYLPVFLNNNKFTIARYLKYLNRGYKIDLGDIKHGTTLPDEHIDVNSFLALKMLNYYARKHLNRNELKYGKRKVNIPDAIQKFTELLTSNIDVLASHRFSCPKLMEVMKRIIYPIADNLRYVAMYIEVSKKEEFEKVSALADRILRVLEDPDDDKMEEVIGLCEQLSISSKKRDRADDDDGINDIPHKRSRYAWMD